MIILRISGFKAFSIFSDPPVQRVKPQNFEKRMLYSESEYIAVPFKGRGVNPKIWKRSKSPPSPPSNNEHVEYLTCHADTYKRETSAMG